MRSARCRYLARIIGVAIVTDSTSYVPAALVRRRGTRRAAADRDRWRGLRRERAEATSPTVAEAHHAIWWRNTVDLITFGLERMLERSRDGSRTQEAAS